MPPRLGVAHSSESASSSRTGQYFAGDCLTQIKQINMIYFNGDCLTQINEINMIYLNGDCLTQINWIYKIWIKHQK